MREFSNIYDFYYKLSDEDAASLIGQIIKEVTIYKKGKEKKEITKEYLPIGLSNKYTNYGKSTGLLYLSEVFPKTKDYPRWFRVAAFSPDDLDMDLDFVGEKAVKPFREEVIQFLLSLPLEDTSYKEVLLLVQEHFKTGELR